MKLRALAAVTACTATLAAAGCRKTDDNKMNYKKAIDTYYASSPACLFDTTVKLPVQKDTGDASATAPYDALFDQGLLVRTTAQKKELLILSRQVTNYDLSDKGRSAWTADPQQPGYGNFCYGTPTVSSIDATTPASDQPGATTTVNYHVGVSGAPAWATAPETETAFPQVRDAVASTAATATLTNTPNGWTVTTGPGRSARKTVRSADGSIVQ